MSASRVSDPAWFPVGWDAATDTFRFAGLDATRVGDAAFLDKRLGIDVVVTDHHLPGDAAEAVPAGEFAALRAAPLESPPAFLFHTAFCCSTLLARALHAPPRAMALK